MSVIRQLWKGSLNDDLIEASNGQEQWPEVEASANGHSVTSRLREKISEVVDLRPAEFPRGAAAIRRQQGVELIPRLTQNLNARMIKIARRGDIWPADVDNISLPAERTTSVELRGVSERVKDLFDNFKEKMLKTPREILVLERSARRKSSRS